MTGDPARERDFFRSLVGLAAQEHPEPLLRQALAILVELSGAREAYIELQGCPGDAPWWAAQGCDDGRVATLREVISRGIVGEAIATGETIVTASALTDPRFRDRGSVKNQAIEAVLCAPIGRDDYLGVVYLQGRRPPERAAAEPGFAPFDAGLREQVELFAGALGPIAERVLRYAKKNTGRAFTGAFSNVVARSSQIRELVERLRLVAGLDVHVLLTGPSGSGKTLLAHAVHQESKRRARPFVEINCATIPEPLLENELFGADPGAHSAVPRAGLKGKVEAAEGGTLFLDEIAELPLTAQSKLLQLLQDRTYYRLGSNQRRTANVRIVAATNVSLEDAIVQRTFREDLYYRLKVFEARVPPLAERREDVALLAAHFCEQAAERHGLTPRTLSPAALRAVQELDWPGNVRELAHRIESAVLQAHLRGVERVEQRDIVPEELEGAPESGESSITLQEAMRRAQKRHVQLALESTEWNVAEAARQLDVARSYLYTLIKTHGLRRVSSGEDGLKLRVPAR